MRSLGRNTCLLIIAASVWFPVIATGEMEIRYTEDGVKIEAEDRWMKLGGTLMWDLDSASAEFWDSEDERDAARTYSGIRRARLNIKSKIDDNWKAKLQFELAEADASNIVKDAYLKYEGWPYVDLIVGQDKEPFGLEAMTSAKKLSFIERSMVSDAFRPGRSVGLSLGAETKLLFGQLGVYEAQNREDDGDTYAATGRLGIEPWNSDTGGFHLGASGSYRDFDGEAFEIKSSGEIHTADNIVYSAEIDTDHLIQYGMETAFGLGPFSLQAEYVLGEVAAVEADEDASFDGFYLAASWFLSGEQRRLKSGTWKRVTPGSRYGAWEVVARYSDLDAAANGQGTAANAYTVGVNWYINSNIRLMTDYVKVRVTEESTDTEITGDGVTCRVQCEF